MKCPDCNNSLILTYCYQSAHDHKISTNGKVNKAYKVLKPEYLGDHFISCPECGYELNKDIYKISHDEDGREIVELKKRDYKEVEYMSKDIQDRLRSDYNYLTELGYEVVGVFLQGSQNYGLDTKDSDIDTKAIILPSLDDIINNKQPVSTTYEIGERKEHIDVKDIRVYFETILKMNISFLEILFTKYKILNPKYEKLTRPLFENRELLASWNRQGLYKTIAGMSSQKLKDLKHPYPNALEKISKFGYDPKQLHHIVRLEEFLIRITYGDSFEDCLKSKNIEFLLSIKNGALTEDEAELWAKQSNDHIQFVVNKEMPRLPQPKNEAKEIYRSVKTALLRKWIKEELSVNGRD